MGRRQRQWEDLIAAVRVKRTHLNPARGWSRERLAAHQEAGWRQIARAAMRTPFYAERYRGLDLERVPLTALPPVDKAELMASFDRAVTDPVLRLDELEAHLQTLAGDDLFADQY